MRRIPYLLFIVLSIFLTGCFETTQELTVNNDGSGVLNYTTDMSNLFSMIGQMGAGDKIDKIQDLDSTIAFSTMVDSMKDLTPQEKQLISKGTMKLMLKVKDEKFLSTLSFPFKKTDDLKILKTALPKVSMEAVKKLAGDKPALPPGMSQENMPKAKTFDDYFTVTVTPNSMTKVLNKELYATAANDEYMKGIQQMSGMGAPMTANYIFNLPRPAKKVEGKGLKLSADKKKVTLNLTSDDFFDEPKKFEYHIEY